MRQLIVGVALVAGFLGAVEAGARTTVTINGTEIVIHVPIQMAGLTGRTMRNPLTGERYGDARLAEFIARESERFWNEGATGADAFFGEKPSGGLSKLRYRDCYTVRIQVSIVPTNVVDKGQVVRLEGYHRILFDDNPNGKMVVWDPATPDPTKDTPSAYTQSLDGEWTSWQDYFGGGGHEIGHLLGLGDDYNDEGTLPGRKDTVMDHGREFDQNIIDRIADLVQQAGVKLPDCGQRWVWDGRIEVENEYNGRNGEHEWRAEYRVKLLEERTDDHEHHVSGMTLDDVLVYDLQPLELSYAFHAKTAWDRGTHSISRNASGEIYSGDVHMNGKASGTLSMEQLSEGEILSGRVAPLDASGRPGEDPAYRSPMGGYECDYPTNSPGWFHVVVTFPIRDEIKKQTRAYYSGITRTGVDPLFPNDPDLDFIHKLPACMPEVTPAVGRLERIDQESLRGERSFEICGGISGGCPEDAPQRITIKWSFDRKRG